MNSTLELRTFKQFAAVHPAFTEASLRWLRFNQGTNGFAKAFVSIGRRVLIDEVEFFRIIDEQNGRIDPGPSEAP